MLEQIQRLFGNVPIVATGRPQVRQIVKIVSEYSGISVDDILSDRHNHPIVKARHVACYLARHFTLLSTTQIGRYLGGRDHSTIIHGIRKTGKRMERDPYIIELVRNCETEIRREWP